MRKYVLFLAGIVLLGSWTGMGYYEGVKYGLSKLPRVAGSIDPDVKSLAGKDLYCFGIFGGVEPCVIAAHNPNGKQVLLVPKSMTEDEPANPDQASPKAN